MTLLPTCSLAHPDNVRCDSCSPKAIWAKLNEEDRRLLLSLPKIWDARGLHERLTVMQVEHAICEVVGDYMLWEPTMLGRAVVEYGRQS